MNRNDDWLVSLSLTETDGQTRTEARLVIPGDDELAGHGQARRNLADREVSRIGAQIAAARALSDLAGQLLQRPPRPLRTALTSGPVCTCETGGPRMREADRPGRAADRSV